MWAGKKRLLSKLMKNMLEETPNGNVHNKESVRRNISWTKHKKKIVGR